MSELIDITSQEYRRPYRTQEETVALIKELMADKGLSAQDCADQLGLQVSTIRAYVYTHKINVVVRKRHVDADLIRVRLPEFVTRRLAREAPERGYSGSTKLVRRLLEIIVEDDMFGAILDE